MNYRHLTIVFMLCIIMPGLADGQGNWVYSESYNAWERIALQDTANSRYLQQQGENAAPDTNFTYEKYADFLLKVSDTSKYVVLPINEFRTTFDNRKVVIGLRHDVDIDLYKAYDFSFTESDLGFRSTYYILHTAPYYLESPSNMARHTPGILPALKTMQNTGGHEIGWHNDLVTLQAVYGMNPASFLHGELSWLRSNGINIFGTASHGSGYCYTYKYLNYYFFEECTWPVVGQFINNLSLPINGKSVPMVKGKLQDFRLEYEAYFLNNNKYFSDASITNNIRWSIGMLDLDRLVPGDRVIILLHPIHWHKASVDAVIKSFHVPEQSSISINNELSRVTITVPVSVNRSALVPVFELSPGAYVKVNGSMQRSGSDIVDFTYPVKYTVYAENRKIIRDWTVIAEYQGTTGIEEAIMKASLNVYPNPSGGRFTLQFNNISSPRTIIEIINQSGIKVFETITEKTGSFSETLDVGLLGKGVYYLKYSGSAKPVTLIIN